MRVVALPFPSAGREAGTVPEWVMLARVGAWLGHPAMPEVIGREHLRSALDYFQRHYAANEADLVIDYHHASILAPAGGATAPAAGWIQKMELRAEGTELWGRVQWTTDAANAVAERRFRYLSPVFRFNAPDRVTGEPTPMIIHSVGLTNTPFLTELPSLNEAGATDGAGEVPIAEGGDHMSLLDSLAEALGLEPDRVASRIGLPPRGDDPEQTGRFEDEQVAGALLANADRVQELEAQLEESAPPVSPAVANALGVPPEADETEVKAALIGLKAPGAALEPVRSALGLPESATRSDILNSIAELQQQRRDEEAEKLVEQAVAAGKIPPAHREFYLREAVNELEATRRVINAMPVLTSPQPNPSPEEEGGSGALTEAERSVCGQLGLSPEAYLSAAD